MKRAARSWKGQLPEPDLAAFDSRFEALLGEGHQQPLAPAGRRSESRGLADGAARALRRLGNALADRALLPARHRGGEDLGGEEVAPRREADGEVASRAPVELGGASGAGAGALAEAPVLHLEEAEPDEAIELRRCCRAVEPECGRRFVTTDGVAPGGDVAVQAAADRVVEGGDPLKALLEGR